MRGLILSAVVGLSVLGSWAPQPEASWLSQALNKLQEPAFSQPYVPPNGVPNAYYQPGPYYPPPPVPSFVPNISGTWYMNGDPYLPCQIIQWRRDGSAEFVNERGSRTWGTVNGDRVWIPEWSDGRSRGLWGTIRGDRIVWPNGTFWSR